MAELAWGKDIDPSLLCLVQGPGTIFLLPPRLSVPGSLPKPSSAPSSLAVDCAKLGEGMAALSLGL